MKRYKPPKVEYFVRWNPPIAGISWANNDALPTGTQFEDLVVVGDSEWKELLKYVSELESEIEYHRARLGLPGGVDRSQPEPVRRPPILVEAPDVTGLPQVQPGRSRASPVRKPSPGQIAAPRPYDPGRRPPLPSWPRVRPGRS